MIHKTYKSRIEDVDSKGRVLVAANAFGNEDSDRDISAEGSFKKTLAEHFKRVKWFLNHNSDFLLGVPVEGKEDYPYLKLLGQLNLKKQLSRDVYEDYKLYAEYEKTLEHSIGVNAVKYTTNEESGIRTVTEWKLWEYSTLYSWGANENTPMLAIKSNKDIVSAIDWLEIMFRKGNYSDEKFKNIETNINNLKSLVSNEPLNNTQKEEPIDVVDEFRKMLNLNLEK